MRGRHIARMRSRQDITQRTATREDLRARMRAAGFGQPALRLAA